MAETEHLTAEERQEAERLHRRIDVWLTTDSDKPGGAPSDAIELLDDAHRLLPRALATITAMEQARSTAYAEGLNAAIAAVWARSLWTVVTYESLYSTRKTDNPACLASDLVKALEALRDTPAPRPPREEGDR